MMINTIKQTSKTATNNHMITNNKSKTLFIPLVLLIVTLFSYIPTAVQCKTFIDLSDVGSFQYTINQSSTGDDMLYFRVSPVAEVLQLPFFQVNFDSCTGLIELYTKHCSVNVTDSCNDDSDQWFPNVTNSDSLTRFYSHSSQPSLTSGRVGIPDQTYYYFYGVKVHKWSPKHNVQLMVQFNRFSTNHGGDYYQYFEPLKFAVVGFDSISATPATYCKEVDEQSGNCTKRNHVSNSKYTLFYTRLENVLDGSVNMGTFCGLQNLRASGQYQEINTLSNVAFSKYRPRVTYIINIGLEPDTSLLLDAAYIPVEFKRKFTKVARRVMIYGLAAVVAVVMMTVALVGFLLGNSKQKSSYRQLN